MTKLGEWHKVYWKFIDHTMVLVPNTKTKNLICFNLYIKYNFIIQYSQVLSKYNVSYQIIHSLIKIKKTLSLKSILYAVFDMFLAPYILYEYMQDYIIYSNIWVCERPHEWLKSVALKSHTIRTDSVLMSCTITKWP